MGLKFAPYKPSPTLTVDDLVRLADALPETTYYMGQESRSMLFRGLSVSKTKQGGWCSILKVTLVDDPTAGEGELGYPPGDYVIYGWGDNPLFSLVGLEAQLASGQARLAPDKYGTQPGEPAQVRGVRRAGSK